MVTDDSAPEHGPGTGRLFEDFAPGEVIYHPYGRTVTEADNSVFTLMTQNVARIHLDQHYAARTEFGRTLVNSTFTLALVTGQSTVDLSAHVYANLGWDEVRCSRATRSTRGPRSSAPVRPARGPTSAC